MIAHHSIRQLGSPAQKGGGVYALCRVFVFFVMSLLGLSLASASVFPFEKTKGRFVRLELPGKNKSFQVAEVQVFSGGQNVALGKKVTMSSQFSDIAKYAPAGLVDLSTSRKTGPRTQREESPWIEIDLGKAYQIDKILLYRSTNTFKGFVVKVGTKAKGEAASYTQEIDSSADVVGLVPDARKIQKLGNIWLIGDQVMLGSTDLDPNSSPRSALYEFLTKNEYSFGLVGYLTTEAGALAANAAARSAVDGTKIAD